MPATARARRSPRNCAVNPEGERSANLDAGRACCPGLGEPFGSAVAAGQPERQAQRGELLEVHLVPRAVDRLVVLVEFDPAAWRGVVPSGARSLHDEAVGSGRLVTGEVGGEHGGRDDRKEPWPVQRRQRVSEKLAWVDLHAVPMLGAMDVDAHATGSAGCQVGQQLWDLPGHPGAHEHDIDASEDRAERRGRRGHLHLLEVVHPDHAVVASRASQTSAKFATTASSCCSGVCRSVSFGTGRYGRRRPVVSGCRPSDWK